MINTIRGDLIHEDCPRGFLMSYDYVHDVIDSDRQYVKLEKKSRLSYKKKRNQTKLICWVLEDLIWLVWLVYSLNFSRIDRSLPVYVQSIFVVENLLTHD